MWASFYLPLLSDPICFPCTSRTYAFVLCLKAVCILSPKSTHLPEQPFREAQSVFNLLEQHLQTELNMAKKGYDANAAVLQQWLRS